MGDILPVVEEGNWHQEEGAESHQEVEEEEETHFPSVEAASPQDIP